MMNLPYSFLRFVLYFCFIFVKNLAIDVCPGFDLKHPSYNVCDNDRFRCPINYVCIEGKFCCISPIYLTMDMNMGGIRGIGGGLNTFPPRPRPYLTTRKVPYLTTRPRPAYITPRPYITARPNIGPIGPNIGAPPPTYETYQDYEVNALQTEEPTFVQESNIQELPIEESEIPLPGTFRPFVRNLVLDTIETLKTVDSPIKKQDFEEGTVGDKGLIKFLQDFLSSFVEKKLSPDGPPEETSIVFLDSRQSSAERRREVPQPPSPSPAADSPTPAETTQTDPPTTITTVIAETTTETTTTPQTTTTSATSTETETTRATPEAFNPEELIKLASNLPSALDVQNNLDVPPAEVQRTELIDLLKEVAGIKSLHCPPPQYYGPGTPFTGFYLSCESDSQCLGRQMCCPTLEEGDLGRCRTPVESNDGINILFKLLRRRRRL